MISVIAGVLLAGLLQVSTGTSMQVRMHAPAEEPKAVMQVLVTYDPLGPADEAAVPDGTPVNLYLEGHRIARDYTEKGQVYFETTPGNFVIDAVLGRADKTRLWVCRRGVTVDEQNEFFQVQCEKVFFLFYPFILPGR